jgi:hypothetical protein
MSWLITQRGPDLLFWTSAVALELLVIGPCAHCGRSRAFWMSPRGVAVARVSVGQC